MAELPFTRQDQLPSCPKCKAIGKPLLAYQSGMSPCDCTPYVTVEHLELRCWQCGYIRSMEVADG